MTTGWQTKKLGDVATLQRGFDLPTPQRRAGPFPVVSSSGISDAHDRSAVCGPGVVTGRSGSIGNVFFVPGDFWPLNTVLYVKDFHGNEPRFIFYLLKSLDLSRFATGAGVPTLNRNFVHEEFVRVPSSADQRRIVSVLDEAFAAVAAAKANTEKSLQNTGALSERSLQEIFNSTDNGWTEKQLGDLATFRNGINYNQRSRGERVRVVGVKDFQNSFWVPDEDLDTVTIDGRLPESDVLRGGDILVVRSNGNPELIGRCMVANGVVGRVSHSGFTIRIRLSGAEVMPGYLCHFMKQSESRRKLIAGGTGISIRSLNQQGLSQLTIRFPSIEVQRTLVAKIESISGRTEAAGGLFRRKLVALDELRKSLLRQAFSGAL